MRGRLISSAAGGLVRSKIPLLFAGNDGLHVLRHSLLGLLGGFVLTTFSTVMRKWGEDAMTNEYFSGLTGSGDGFRISLESSAPPAGLMIILLSQRWARL